MVVRRYQVPDGFARNQLPRFGEDRKSPLLGLRTLNYGHMILEFDCQAVVRSAGYVPQAIAELLGFRPNSRPRRTPHRLRGRQTEIHIRLYIRHIKFSRWEPAFGLDDLGWELHAAEVFVVRERYRYRHVSQHR